MNCSICPRKCNINRSISSGFCLSPNHLVVSKVMLHHFEEPILTAENEKGRGAIFLSGCNMRCVYCQNYEISHKIVGEKVSVEKLIEIFKSLEKAGAGNIDLVSPTHYSNLIIQALKIYKPSVPVVWNSNGYESCETLKQPKGLVDIYLVDFKYANNQSAIKYSKTPNYVETAKNALKEMKNQQKTNIFKNGKLVKGIIVRHLVLPNLAKDSTIVLDIIHNILGKNAIVSIMSQYVPMFEATKLKEMNRKITKLEYKLVVNHALKLGLNNSFIQDLDSSCVSYTPDFKNNVFEIK